MKQDTFGQMSANPPPPWCDATDWTGQKRSWGLAAMNNSSPAQSNRTETVYVLDMGIEGHNDLPSIYSSNQLHGLNMSNGGVVSSDHNPVGCYPHATHVAGIIGAQNNGYGSVGMVLGVNIVSIALTDRNLYWYFYNGSQADAYAYATFANPFGECGGGVLPYYGTWSFSGANNALEYVLRISHHRDR